MITKFAELGIIEERKGPDDLPGVPLRRVGGIETGPDRSRRRTTGSLADARGQINLRRSIVCASSDNTENARTSRSGQVATACDSRVVPSSPIQCQQNHPS